MQTPEGTLEVPTGTDREYELVCKVKVIERYYYEISDNKRHKAKMVLLLPRLETSEAGMFLNAYLPEVGTYCLNCQATDLLMDHRKCPECGSENVKTEHTEVAAFIGYPVLGPSRLALLRKNNYCVQHHLFVMGTGAEQDLLDKDGKEVHVKIFNCLSDGEVDTAKSVEKQVK